MNYYWFNRQEILQKAKEKYSKEKAAEYYKQNKEAIKKSQESVIKPCHKKKKVSFKEYQKIYIYICMKNLFDINNKSK